MVVPSRTIVCVGVASGLGTSLLPRSCGMAAWEPEEKGPLACGLVLFMLVASYQVWMECSQGILYVRGAEDKCAIFSE